MAQCTGTSVVRDENREAIRDYVTGEPMRKQCKNHGVRGIEPAKCIIHCTPLERQKASEATFMKRHEKEISELLWSLDIEMNPMDGLIEAVRVSGGMMRVFQVLTSELNETPYEEVTLSVTGAPVAVEVAGLWGHDHKGDAQPHVLLNLLGVWTDRFSKACKMALDAGIDERLVRNAEATSATFLTAFERAMKSVNLSDVQRLSLAQAMGRELREAISAPLTELEVINV
jgi:hypothetical protein